MTSHNLGEFAVDRFIDFFAERHGGFVGPTAETETTIEGIWRSGTVSAVDLADQLAAFCAMPRAELDFVVAHPARHDLSWKYLREARVFPFEKEGRVAIALADPTRTDVQKAVQLALNARPEIYIASFDEIELLFERAAEHALDSKDPAPLAITAAADLRSETAEELHDLARGAPIVRLIDQILEKAVNVGATDVHLETERDSLSVRLRVDGFLRREQTLPAQIAPAVISRIKILGGLDIADRRLPQDGRSNLRIGNAEADLRIAVMPTIYGETAVIRILLRNSKLLELGRIGMTAKDQVSFQELLAEPHGLIVVTGPTGSGKTTTLATAISLLNDPSRKIVTIEDPIEYQVAGVHQTQIKPAIGLTFASALRAFLRHDPDIIMVGEMRDRDTAAIGIQAALTGHLVLTTLHTNSAADAVVRLIDMGIEPFLLSASLRGVLGQRLVRKLCERCRRPDEGASHRLNNLAKQRGIPISADTITFAGHGCEACGHTGYRGRVGLFEVMRTDDHVQDIIREGANSKAIAAQARKLGMTMMLEDGINKCAQGLTSIEEVLRAAG